MASTLEGLLYYCTVFLTTIVFLTEASAIATNYEKSIRQDDTYESHNISISRVKPLVTRGRSVHSSKNQNHERGNAHVLTKPKVKTESSLPNSGVSEALLFSNSGGENDIKDKSGGGNTDDDDQKTLSQQVSDGKYGLIQDEIFTIRPQRPGIISYDVNPEVPKDNINNLGGLEPDDIWLAENHLLVLAQGSLGSMQSFWTPIDNYVAPRRPVKIPPNPRVPPPFPVQLSENGPIEYIGSAEKPTQPINLFNPLPMQYPIFNRSQNYVPSSYDKVPAYNSPGWSPFKPSLAIHANLPRPSPILTKSPPGAEFIPPYLGIKNQSETIDEDDPSLYYPPPYDFYYPSDNTTKVPPGPLVPGILLPPPSDFFSSSVDPNKPVESPKAILGKDKKVKPSIHKFGKQLQQTEVHSGSSSPSSPPNTVRPVDLHSVNFVNNTRSYENNTAQGWMPIPAPQPFYITDPLKQLKNTVLIMMNLQDNEGYVYTKPQNLFKVPKINQQSAKFLHYDQKTVFPSTTPFSSQIVRTPIPDPSPVYTTTPLSPFNPSPTIEATYYFYEEPKFENVDELPRSTVAPSNRVQLNPQSDASKKRKPIAPMIPIYYLTQLGNFVNPDNVPYTEVPKSKEYYTTTAKPTYAIIKPNYERPTPKPIFQYNYVASGYESTSPTPTTPQYNVAPNYNVNYETYYQPLASYPLQHHYNPIQTTATPLLILDYIEQNIPKYYFQQPWINLHSYNQQDTYSTDSPLYMLFTKEDEYLIDDNTKKFFTLFGRKLRPTSPLPDSYLATTPAATVIKSRYPSHALSSPVTLTYQSSSSTYNPLSLEDDTRVNYITPLLPKDPDAEYVPSKVMKHIRPIVVEDLPFDFDKRLQDLMNLDKSKYPTYQAGRVRYSLLDTESNPRELSSSSKPSLESDIHVNYKYTEKLSKNPDAEYIPSLGYYSKSREKYVARDTDSGEESRSPKPVSLGNDILVNYKRQYGIDLDAEYVDTSSKRNLDSDPSNVGYEQYSGSRLSHYYFLNPEETHLSQVDEEGYAIHSDAEKPSNYFKRGPQKREESVQKTTNAP